MYERSWTVEFPPGGNPGAAAGVVNVPTVLPGGDHTYMLEAWQGWPFYTFAGTFVLPNFVIANGTKGLGEIQQQVAEANAELADVLMVVPTAGTAKVRVNPEGNLTVAMLSPNPGGFSLFVTMRLYEI